MTTDRFGQGLIDFTEMFSPKTHNTSTGRRRKLKPEDAVPEWEVKRLATVITRSRLTQIEVGKKAGLSNNFLSKVLSGSQYVSRAEFEKIFHAAAEMVFDKICEA